MEAWFYIILFAFSLLCAGIYIFIWHKHFDVNLNMVFTLVPIACLGYIMSAQADNLRSALAAQQVIYIGGCYLQLFILLCILNLCSIDIKGWLRLQLFAVCSLVYASTLTMGKMDIFYSYAAFDRANGGLIKKYGYMHTVFYALVVLLFLSGVVAIVYSLCRKKQVPRRILLLLFIPDSICLFCYFIGRRLFRTADVVPLGYVLAEIIFLLIAYRRNLYDISDTVIDSMVKENAIAYISFDFRCRYLGCNEVATQLIPGLKNMSVDELFGYQPYQRKIRHYLDHFREDEKNNSFLYTAKDPEGNEELDRIYNVGVNYLYDGNRKRGYIITFRDDTAKQKYISLLDGYNAKLTEEVEEKTRHIVQMHDNLIMSLAMMVESRDNSTGGHIKRTSENVRILVDEIRKEGKLSLSEEFCRDVIKAAPMHDLGKIAVDDAILRKPGRFTDEEFEKMKMHAAEGARVIHEILLNTEDESFKQIAENVAHYHHERWDGSGYPEKIAGEQIPLEARIMAIADVYDALVSKRVYKEAMSFEKADSIIMEGMGTQFDPGLKSIYENARPRLEKYYSDIEPASRQKAG